MSLIFSDAQNDQVTELCALVNRSYRGESSKVGWTTEADLLGGQRVDDGLLIELINPPLSKILTATDSESQRLVGCVHLEKRAETMYLGMLVVSPDIQAQGLGRKIVLESEKQAKEWSCSEIEMSVISVRKELIAWYERLGFVVTDERKPFPMNDPRFGLPKVNTLEFVILRKRISPLR
jgi:ribosomal protein S18 acetylase RimI-like enzyme